MNEDIKALIDSSINTLTNPNIEFHYLCNMVENLAMDLKEIGDRNNFVLACSYFVTQLSQSNVCADFQKNVILSHLIIEMAGDFSI